MTTPYVSGASSIEPERPQDGPSIGERLGDVTRDLSTLMRQEVALAQAERTTAHVMTVDGGNIEAALR